MRDAIFQKFEMTHSIRLLAEVYTPPKALTKRSLSSDGKCNSDSYTFIRHNQAAVLPKGAYMNREEATQKILEAKHERGLTFEAIASEVGRHKEWTTAALYGQATMSAEEAERTAAVLGLGPDVVQ